jgi:heme exporter protein D
MDLGPHAATIWACYASVAAVLGGLIAWLVADGRRLAAEIARLEARGIRRRSSPASAAEPRSPSDPEPNTRA